MPDALGVYVTMYKVENEHEFQYNAYRYSFIKNKEYRKRSCIVYFDLSVSVI